MRKSAQVLLSEVTVDSKQNFAEQRFKIWLWYKKRMIASYQAKLQELEDEISYGMNEWEASKARESYNDDGERVEGDSINLNNYCVPHDFLLEVCKKTFD